MQSSEAKTIELVHMEWTWGLQRFDIFSLLHMPHFGQIVEVNTCVEKVLDCFHDGYLCLDIKVPIQVDLIATITRFPKVGGYPALLGNIKIRI